MCLYAHSFTFRYTVSSDIEWTCAIIFVVGPLICEIDLVTVSICKTRVAFIAAERATIDCSLSGLLFHLGLFSRSQSPMIIHEHNNPKYTPPTTC